MTFHAHDGRYLSQIYFASDGATVDVLGFLYRDPDEPFHLMVPFRYYASSDPWDGDDKKSWHEFTFESRDEEQASKHASDAFRFIAATMPGLAGKALQLEVIPVRSDRAEVMAKRLAEQSWTHAK